MATHDLDRTVRQFTAGKHVDWPPPPKPGPRSGPRAARPPRRTRCRPCARSSASPCSAPSASCRGRALRQPRRRRARELATFELRLGRDDLSNPFRVQEAFEGDHRRAIGAAGTSGSGAARTTSRSRSTGSRTARSASRWRCRGRWLAAVIAGPLEDLYPDVRLIERRAGPTGRASLSRLKKRRSYVLSLQTLRNYEHAFNESLVALLGLARGQPDRAARADPRPELMCTRARGGCSSAANADSTTATAATRSTSASTRSSRPRSSRARSRPSTARSATSTCASPATTRRAVRRVAGRSAQLRSENELVRRDMRLRRRLYARRIERALPNPLPGLRSAACSRPPSSPRSGSSRARAPSTPASRARRCGAPSRHPRSDRDPELRAAATTSTAPSGSRRSDRKYGHALIGGQGAGKTSCLRPAPRDRRAATATRAIVLIDAKGPLAEARARADPRATAPSTTSTSASPRSASTRSHIGASPGARAAVFVRALIEANPPGAIQAASDSFLRQAIAAVCAVEPRPTLWHVYRMLEFRRPSPLPRAASSTDSTSVAGHGLRPQLLAARVPRAARATAASHAQALNPPRNKLERLISTRETDLLLRHPYQLDLAGVIERGEVLSSTAPKRDVGEDNARLIMQLLLRCSTAPPSPAAPARRTSGGEYRCYSTRPTTCSPPRSRRCSPKAARPDSRPSSPGSTPPRSPTSIVRSGVRSLLQSISIFRMRETRRRPLARRARHGRLLRPHLDRPRRPRTAALLRRRHHPPDIHHAINLWVANGTPTPRLRRPDAPLEHLHDAAARRTPPPSATRPRRPPPQPPARPARTAPASNRPPTERDAQRTTRATSTATRDAHRAAASGRTGQPTNSSLGRPRGTRLMAPPASYRAAHRYDGAMLQRDNADRRRARGVPGLARATSRSSATSGATSFLDHRPARASSGGPAARGQAAPQAARQALPRRLPRPLPPRTAAQRLLPMDLPARRRRPQTPPTRRRDLDPAARFKPATVYRLRLRPPRPPTQRLGLAYRRLLGDRLLDWHGETPVQPPPERQQATWRSTKTGRRRPHKTPSRDRSSPTPLLEISRPRRASTTDLPDRVRPHPPRRQELRQVPPLRHLPHRWWHHTPRSPNRTTTRSPM